MPLFLAIYTMTRADLAKFRAMPKADQDAADSLGVPQWQAWSERHADAIVDHGGMVGKTTRITRDGRVAPATNDICGYLVVEAETAEAAAGLFADHPHIGTFPGDAVDIMPFLTQLER